MDIHVAGIINLLQTMHIKVREAKQDGKMRNSIARGVTPEWLHGAQVSSTTARSYTLRRALTVLQADKTCPCFSDRSEAEGSRSG